MATAVLMPKSGPTVESCVLGNWEKKIGDQVKKGDILFTYETDKTAYECVAHENGVLLAVFYNVGDEVPVLTPVCAIGEPGEDVSALRPGEEAPSAVPDEAPQAEVISADVRDNNFTRISPRARKFARENRIDITLATPTGPMGRIIERDLQKCLSAPAPSAGSLEYEDVKLSGIRRTISRTMHTSLSSMAQLTHNMSFDAAALLACRKQFKGRQDAHAAITLGDMILYAVSRLLPKYPELNAHLLEQDTIRCFKHVNLGVAVDTPRGLMVPTIFCAEQKSLLEISEEVKTLADACRKGTISPDLLSGSSFTVSNLGSLGVESFTPIINPPQTAILGVCGITERVKKNEDGSLGSYSAMTLSLTYDHRAIDGSPASRFERELCEMLEHFGDITRESSKKCFTPAPDGIYDLLIIGGGPGGYHCAEQAAKNGMKVALFEEKALGGTCLNEGCIPTKTLLNSAKMYRHATEGEAFGVTAEGVCYHHDTVIDRKNNVVKSLVSGIAASMRASKVEVVSATATIKGKHKDGFSVLAGGKTYTGERLVIATGSTASVPPINGLEKALSDGFAVTSKEILDEKALPCHLAIIGGGVIGLEMAYYFASVGTRVTVIESTAKLAGGTDDDICRVLTDALTARGVVCKLSAQVLEIGDAGIVYTENGEKCTLPCDKILLCTGRRPRTEGIGLEALGLEMDRAAIKTNLHLETGTENVYAIGDCNGKSMLAHTAYREAEVAVNHMLGGNDSMRYDVIPSVIYTDPEVACVGLTLAEAKARGRNAREIKLPMAYSGRYVAETVDGKGMIKLVVDTRSNTILGCHIIGAYASEIVMTATMMIDTELTADRLRKLVFPHPTVSEIIKEAIFKI